MTLTFSIQPYHRQTREVLLSSQISLGDEKISRIYVSEAMIRLYTCVITIIFSSRPSSNSSSSVVAGFNNIFLCLFLLTGLWWGLRGLQPPLYWPVSHPRHRPQYSELTSQSQRGLHSDRHDRRIDFLWIWSAHLGIYNYFMYLFHVIVHTLTYLN